VGNNTDVSNMLEVHDRVWVRVGVRKRYQNFKVEPCESGKHP
jgi:hypothetical protein